MKFDAIKKIITSAQRWGIFMKKKRSYYLNSFLHFLWHISINAQLVSSTSATFLSTCNEAVSCIMRAENAKYLIRDI